jgi:anti-sigma factor RsiW
MHLNEDDLVLHYYGEMDPAAEARAAAHIAGCDGCHAHYTRLQRVLAAVDSAPALEPPAGFERAVWARLEPGLARRRRGFSWFVAAPARLAWAAAIVTLVGASFVAGRLYRAPDAAPRASAAQVRERILLVDLGDHLDRSQMVLVEIASAGGDGSLDLTAERERAAQLVRDNRLYRRTAMTSGDTTIADFLDDLERVLVEVAAAPPTDAGVTDASGVQQRLDARDLLFKLRVMSAEVRERQKPGNKTT